MPECGHSFTEIRWEAANVFGEPLPFRVLHITELLAEGIADGRIRVNKAPQSATYHDACQLSRRGGATAAPRVILQALGVELHELEDFRRYELVLRRGWRRRPDQAGATAARSGVSDQATAVEATGYPTVYTSCSGCRQTLDHGGKAVGWTKTVASLLELVADNLKD